MDNTLGCVIVIKTHIPLAHDPKGSSSLPLLKKEVMFYRQLATIATVAGCSYILRYQCI